MVNNVKKEIELYDKMCGWLQVYLEDKYKIDNNILEIYIELEKTTLLKEIFNFLKKGLM